MKPEDLSSVEKSVNDDAGKASAIWITFITFELYLLMAFGSISYRDLLLETSLKLPLLGTELPLLGFSEIAPALLVIFHYYVLLQFAVFDQKLAAYEAALEQAYAYTADRESARQKLGFFFRMQSSSGTKLQRRGVIGSSLRLIAWLTLVAAPVLILLQALLAFLPYHNQRSIWTIRTLIGADVLLIMCFWSAIHGSASRSDRCRRFVRLSLRMLNSIILLVIFGFAVAITTYPGEQFVGYLPYRASLDGLRSFLFGGAVDEVTGRPRGYLSNRIVVTDQVLVTDQQGRISPIKPFRGRDLRDAVFTRSDLRGVDFTGAMLNGAVFTGAQLQGAEFGCSDTGASKEGQSWLEEKRELAWPDDGCTWLQGANFSSANLQKASFFFSHMEASEFADADLSRAEFSFVTLNGASFSEAKLGGATIEKSKARGSSFFSADLRAASLFETDLTGSVFEQATLQAAALNRAMLDGGTFLRASMQGAIVTDASLRGTFFTQAKVWRANWQTDLAPTIEYTNFDKIDDGVTPWDDEVDVKQKSFLSWQQMMLKLAPGSDRDDMAELVATLDPKKKAPLNADLKGLLAKQNPKYRIEDQLALLADLICSEDDQYPMAYRIVGEVSTFYREGMMSKERIRQFSSGLREKVSKGRCAGIQSADDDFWNELEIPEETSSTRSLTKPLP